MFVRWNDRALCWMAARDWRTSQQGAILVPNSRLAHGNGLYKERKKAERKKGEWQKKKKWKNKSQILSVVSELYPYRFELETVLSWSPCRHPYNHFAGGEWTKNDKTAWSQCVPSRCLWYQHVRQKSVLKIATFRVSNWSSSATVWGLWMGPWHMRLLPVTSGNALVFYPLSS